MHGGKPAGVGGCANFHPVAVVMHKSGSSRSLTSQATVLFCQFDSERSKETWTNNKKGLMSKSASSLAREPTCRCRRY